MKFWRAFLVFDLLSEEDQPEPLVEVEEEDRDEILDASKKEFFDSLDEISDEENQSE